MSAEQPPDEQPKAEDVASEDQAAEAEQAPPRTLGQRLVDRILDADDGGDKW